jgi:hypothetical protein
MEFGEPNQASISRSFNSGGRGFSLFAALHKTGLDDYCAVHHNQFIEQPC